MNFSFLDRASWIPTWLKRPASTKSKLPNLENAMSPRSQERIEWIATRLSVLDDMKKDLIQRHAWYAQAMQASPEVITHTVMTIRVEELQLQVEFNILTKTK